MLQVAVLLHVIFTKFIGLRWLDIDQNHFCMFKESRGPHKHAYLLILTKQAWPVTYIFDGTIGTVIFRFSGQSRAVKMEL